MIFISNDVTCGSSRFCFELMKAVRSAFVKHFDAEQMQEFGNDLEFQKMIWLADLSKSDFNFVAKTIQSAKLTHEWLSEKQTLIDLLKADPRYTAP